MQRAAIFPLLALFTLAAPRTAHAAFAENSTSAAPQDSLQRTVFAAFERTAERTQGLSGHALRDSLDEIAVSTEFWSGFRTAMTELASSPDAQRQIDEFMRSEANRQVVPPGVPPHLMYRAIAAATAAAELLPAGMSLSAVMEQTADELDEVATKIEQRLGDRNVPVALRRMERRAVRGMAAGMVLATLGESPDPIRYTQLLKLYTEGMENLVRFVAFNLEGAEAANADAMLHDLGLEPLQRGALQWRADHLEQAYALLSSTANDLDGEPLRLPPDPGFRPTES